MCSQQHVEGAVVRNAPLQCSREQTIGGGSLMASIADRIPVAYRILMCVSVGRALARRPTVGVQLMDFFFLFYSTPAPAPHAPYALWALIQQTPIKWRITQQSEPCLSMYNGTHCRRRRRRSSMFMQLKKKLLFQNK